jgi:putative flippase GtrA
VVGGAAFLVDSATLFVLTAAAGFHYLVSAAAGFTLGLIVNYLLSRWWVFRKRSLSNAALEFSLFALIGIVGLGLNEALIWFFTEKAGFHYLLSKCCAAAIVLAWTYLARRKMLFSGESGALHLQAHRRRRSYAPVAAALCLYPGLTLALQWAGLAYRYPLTQYPDESAHYVTGLLVHDYLTHPAVNPLAFAREFYVHYPRISLIHWPPMLYAIEGAWMAVAGASLVSALVLMALLAAALAGLIHRTAERHLGRGLGLPAGLLFVLLGATQAQAGMVMMEIPLALGAFASCLAFAAFMATGRARHSLLFGALAAATILTRFDGWCLALVPPLAILWLRRWDLVRGRNLWLSALVALPLCLPYTLITWRFARTGWHEHDFSWKFVREALPMSWTVLRDDFGIAGLLLIAAGAAAATLRHRGADRRSDPLWTVLACFAACYFAFQNVVPAGIEHRKLFPLAPAAVLFMTGGAALLASRIPRLRGAAGAASRAARRRCALRLSRVPGPAARPIRVTGAGSGTGAPAGPAELGPAGGGRRPGWCSDCRYRQPRPAPGPLHSARHQAAHAGLRRRTAALSGALHRSRTHTEAAR